MGLATAAKVFIPLWLTGAGINMWLGVTKAGVPLGLCCARCRRGPLDMAVWTQLNLQ